MPVPSPSQKTEAGRRDNDDYDVEESVIADVPCGYQITSVATAIPVGYAVVNQAQLVPYLNEGKWHHELTERCCKGGGDCMMAWFCPVFPLAQIAERLKFWGVRPTGYNEVMFMAVLLFLLDLAITLLTGEGSSSMYILCVILCCQLRAATRLALGIPGNERDDCLLACFCQVIKQ